ncbi:MAG: transcriptional regulator GcvA [Leptolyngbyaceae cyanobacterium]
MRELPPLNALRAFEAAARHMSFQRAAEELQVTPTAISHQIKNLETYLRLPLFIRRNPHPLQLTDAGQHLYPVLRQGFDAFAEAISVLQPDTASTTLTVTAINDFALKWLGPRLPQFQRAFPDIDIHLQTTVQVIDLQTRTVDMAIRYGRGEYPGLVAHTLFSDTYIPVCSPVLMQSGSLQAPQDLAHHTLLHCEWVNYTGPDQPTWQRWLTLAGVTTMNPTKGPKFTGESLAIQAAINGQGVALCSSIHVADDLARGLLVQPFDIALDGFSFYAVYLKDHPKEAQIASFVTWMEDVIKINDLKELST